VPALGLLSQGIEELFRHPVSEVGSFKHSPEGDDGLTQGEDPQNDFDGVQESGDAGEDHELGFIDPENTAMFEPQQFDSSGE
jgi:hypothetical protein